VFFLLIRSIKKQILLFQSKVQYYITFNIILLANVSKTISVGTTIKIDQGTEAKHNLAKCILNLTLAMHNKMAE